MISSMFNSDLCDIGRKLEATTHLLEVLSSNS